MDWSRVKKEHVDQAIKKFIEEKPEHPEPRSYYLIYEGEKLPSKYIRGMAYSIATGEEFSLDGFSGGTETVNFFKKYGYTVEQVSDDDTEDKYSVNDAVWIATALLAAEQYTLNPNATREDMFFKQSDIVKKAQSLITSKVDSARVSWWVNADNEKHTQNYLRADSAVDLTARRLSMMDEFPDKAYPTGLSMSDEFDINSLQMTMEELFFFVKEQYPEVMKKAAAPSNGRAWLLTWNPGSWNWTNYKAWCKDTKLGNKFVEPWTCASKQPAVGDEIFLIKTGDPPRGILAHGYVAKGTYEADHYDPKKAAAGVKSNHIDAEYDWIQDYDSEPMLMQDDLKIKLPAQLWSPLGSGIEIKSSVLPELRKMWLELIGKKNEDATYWPSLEEYDPGITKEKWVELLNDPDVTNEDNLRMFKMMLELDGESTCANLAEIYGGSAGSYNNWGRIFGERVHRKTNCPLCVDGDRQRYYTIPFVGRYVVEKGKRRYSWKFRSELEEALKEMDLSHIDLTTEEESVISYDKNMILFGPPGTGKTYSTAIYAVAICDQIDLDSVKAMEYDEVMIRYRELLAEGRVAFTTFHQSYGYEEFIEGIKPILNGGSDIGYTIEDGVFKKFCGDARMPENNDIQCFGELWAVRSRAGDSDVPFDYEDYLYKNGVIMVETNDEYDKRQCNMISRMKKGDWVVLGRDYKIAALGVIDDEEVSEIDCEPFHWKRKVNWLVTGLSATFADIGIVCGCFSNFAIARSKHKVQNFYKLIKTEKKKAKPHVFVIDEINRGNISKIFGELITLIEDTKREGMDEQAAAVLPYSGESFSVPANVYILGTMNTADRSIALMDTALRRRFQFVEMMPDADVLRDIGADKVDDLDVAAMLEKINERITFLYDREHTIGHAFFTKLAKAPTIEILKAIFEKSVIPLLQEYFYEDYQKIQLVLGDNGKTDPSIKFILDEEVKVKNIFKGNADDVVDLPDKKYTINAEAFDNLESYKQII